jgi:hypothetical protein
MAVFAAVTPLAAPLLSGCQLFWGLSAAGLQLRPLFEVIDQTPETLMEFLELVRATAWDENVHLRYWQAEEEHKLELSTEVPELRSRHEQGEPSIEI